MCLEGKGVEAKFLRNIAFAVDDHKIERRYLSLARDGDI